MSPSLRGLSASASPSARKTRWTRCRTVAGQRRDVVDDLVERAHGEGLVEVGAAEVAGVVGAAVGDLDDQAGGFARGADDGAVVPHGLDASTGRRGPRAERPLRRAARLGFSGSRLVYVAEHGAWAARLCPLAESSAACSSRATPYPTVGNAVEVVGGVRGMADIYQEAAETIVNADRAGAEEVAKRALDCGHRARRHHAERLRQGHPGGRRALRERRGLPPRADDERRRHGRRHRGHQRRPRGRRRRGQGHDRHRHRAGRRARHRQGDRHRLPQGQRLRRHRPRPRRRRRDLHHQGQGERAPTSSA